MKEQESQQGFKESLYHRMKDMGIMDQMRMDLRREIIHKIDHSSEAKVGRDILMKVDGEEENDLPLINVYILSMIFHYL